MADPLLFTSLSQLAALVRRGELSAVELVQSHLEHISSHNAAVNAIVTIDPERVLEHARLADRRLATGSRCGPLHGVPITVKDAIETADYPTTSGTHGLRDHRAKQDAAIVERLRAAGAIVLGKTNLPALTQDYQTNNTLFGRTNNPWDLERSPGGSTGGGAAAVAAGFSPLDIGSDVGGSVRLPAHYCGVCGLKPTSQLIPMSGHIPPWPGTSGVLRHLVSIGFIARSVEDLGLALRLGTGPDDKDWDVVPVPIRPRQPVALSSLRIGWTDCLPGTIVSAEIRGAIARMARELGRLGCSIEHSTPEGLSTAHACEVYGAIFAAEIGAGLPERIDVEERARGIRLTAEQTNEPFTKGYARGTHATSREYLAALNQRSVLIDRWERFLGRWDAYLCPVAPTVAITHTTTRTSIDVDGQPLPYLAQGWSCLPFNLTHQPVVVIPVDLCASGLPCGIQVVGRLWRDAELLAVAETLASALPPLPLNAAMTSLRSAAGTIADAEETTSPTA